MAKAPSQTNQAGAPVPFATPETALEIARAIEVFARGFAFTRSFTHPYLATRVGPLRVMRDGPRKRHRDYRREEWIAYGVEPAEVDRLARQGTRSHYALCVLRGLKEPDGPLREVYKNLGYRLGTTEPLFVHRLRRIPRLVGPYPVSRVATADLAERLAKAAGSRQVLAEHLNEDSPLRQYVALERARPIGWVRSITVGDATWVSNMHVESPYRRRGIGQSLLAHLLRDDRFHGATASFLLASHAGALLYPRVGYEQIGELLLFTPKRKAAPRGSAG